ncbi:MAG: hypothetical protein IPH16_10835 [Haliscomenobacter sp.]|nr:hypothetical protein [Haliscomenobacter sp.]
MHRLAVLPKLLSVLAVLSCASAMAQTSMRPNGGAKGTAMGNAFVGLPGISGVYGNPANLTSIGQWESQLYAQNRFLLPELKEIGISLAAPALGGTAGIGLRQSGYSGYKEQLAQICYSRLLGPGFGLGIRFDLGALSIPEYGNLITVNGSFGMHADLLPGLTAAVLIDHPLRQTGISAEFMPTLLGAGIRYEASEKTSLLIELIKDVEYPASFRAGLDYQLLPILSLQTGIATAPSLFSMGAALHLSPQFRLDIASSYHQWLGFTPAIGLTFSNNKKEGPIEAPSSTFFR